MRPGTSVGEGDGGKYLERIFAINPTMSAAASCSEKTIEAVHPADIVDTTAFELDTAGHCSTPETTTTPTPP